MNQNVPLWSPSPQEIAASPISAFMRLASEAIGRSIADYDALHAWSVEDRESFWPLIWDF